MKKSIVAGLIAFVITILGLGTAGAIALLADNTKDSGVVACEQMKKNAEDGKQSNSDAPMTAAQHMEKRAPFANSRYPDLKTAGTNLVDTVYQMDQKKDDETDLGGALVMLTTIRTQYAALQTACGAHGVDLPNLPSS